MKKARKLRLTVFCCMLVGALSSAFPQDVPCPTDLTTLKGVKMLASVPANPMAKPMTLKAGKGWFRVILDTPAAAARDRADYAKVHLTPQSTSPDDEADVLRVWAVPYAPPNLYGPFSNVDRIVLRSSSGEVVQPLCISLSTTTETYRNGAVIPMRRGYAVFAMDDVRRLQAASPDKFDVTIIEGNKQWDGKIDSKELGASF